MSQKVYDTVAEFVFDKNSAIKIPVINKFVFGFLSFFEFGNSIVYFLRRNENYVLIYVSNCNSYKV
jgi:hypothetical protein